MANLTFSGLPSGVVKTSMDGETYTEATSPITLVDGMYIFVSGYYQLIGQSAKYLTNVHVDNKDSDIWSTSKSDPYILTYGGALSYTTSLTSTENINYYAKYVEIPKTTFDLSTLSDITDGAHTVKVKAKADGYRDSDFSNEVSYTKAPAGYSGNVRKTGDGIVYYEINKDTITSYQNLTKGQHSVTGVVSFYCESGEDVYDISITNTVNCGAVTHNSGYLITPTADNFSFTVNSEPI